MADPTTPILGLTKPVVNGTPDPVWANEINSNWALIDSLCYSSGNQVPTSGLNINADVSFNSFNETNVRSVRFNIQSGTLTGANDKNEVYCVSGNLYWNSGGGAAVQITNGGNVISSGTAGSFPGVAIVSNTSLTPGFANALFVNSSVGAITLTLPAANTCAVGKTFFIFDSGANASVNNITLTPTGDSILANGVSNGGNVVLKQNAGAWMVTTNGNNLWGVLASQQDTVQNKVTFNNGIAIGALTLQTAQHMIFYSNVSSGWTHDGVTALGATSGLPQFFPLTKTIHGANLTSVVASMNTGAHPSGAPQKFPHLDIWRYTVGPESGSQARDLIASAQFYTSSYPTGASWNQGGNIKFLTANIAASSSFQLVDNTNYMYYAGITDENGTAAVAGNNWNGFFLNHSNVVSYSSGV